MDRKIDKKQLNRLRKNAETLHEKDEAFKKASDRDFAIWLLIVLVAAFAVRLFLFEPIRVSGDSMYDTLIDGERMFVEKVSYWFERPQRGEIIICYYPNHTTTCVKRVIGVPGDRIAILGGEIYLNGEKLDESAYWEDVIWSDMAEITVPEDCVFVMGDNRNGSSDSRNPLVGSIPYNRVVGRVRSVIWPVARARTF
ncbi:MAG: signal peptidase I [Christensenellales bacterium]